MGHFNKIPSTAGSSTDTFYSFWRNICQKELFFGPTHFVFDLPKYHPFAKKDLLFRRLILTFCSAKTLSFWGFCGSQQILLGPVFVLNLYWRALFSCSKNILILPRFCRV